MKIVFFGSGSAYSATILDALARSRPVAAVFRPRIHGGGWRGLLARVMMFKLSTAMRRVVAAHRLPVIDFDPADIDSLRRLDPDLLCVASFPSILRRAWLEVPRLGALNLHPSLLPRHRGADPFFWTFFCDDREAGVSVHWMTEGVDDGDVLLQASIPVQRGDTMGSLQAALARLGGPLLVAAVDAVEAGTATRRPQDPGAVTLAPLPGRTTWSVAYERWPAERIWHFLRGVGTHRLRDGSGNRIVAGPALSFAVASHPVAPGSYVAPKLYCIDGWVELAPPSLRRRLWFLLTSGRNS